MPPSFAELMFSSCTALVSNPSVPSRTATLLNNSKGEKVVIMCTDLQQFDLRVCVCGLHMHVDYLDIRHT